MKKFDDLPQCRDDFGSCWDDSKRYVRDQESAQCSMTGSEETLGFRLARDGGQRSFIGGAWRFSSTVAGTPAAREANAPFYGAFIGFRLTWEKA